MVASLAWMFGDLVYWLGSFISADVAKYLEWDGWAGTAAVFLPLFLSLNRYERKERKLGSRDLEDLLIQEIHVTDPRVVEVAMLGNLGPNLAIDIGDDKILYLQGQWLYDSEIYGANAPENDEGDDSYSGHPAPHSFPSFEFKISRWPNSGRVFQVVFKHIHFQQLAIRLKQFFQTHSIGGRDILFVSQQQNLRI